MIDQTQQCSYKQQWYQRNRDRILAFRTTKVYCGCGAIVSRRHLGRHLQTLYHKSAIEYSEPSSMRSSHPPIINYLDFITKEKIKKKKLEKKKQKYKCDCGLIMTNTKYVINKHLKTTIHKVQLEYTLSTGGLNIISF